MSEVPFLVWYSMVCAVVMIYCLNQYIVAANKGRERQRLEMDLDPYPTEAQHWLRMVVLSAVFGPFFLVWGILILLKETVELAKRDLVNCLIWSRAHQPDPMNHEDFLT